MSMKRKRRLNALGRYGIILFWMLFTLLPIYTAFVASLTEYQKLGKSDFVDFLDEWYDYGRFEQNKIINKYPFEYNISVEDEFMKHKRWIDKTKIRATPVILFNGYEIPHEIYEMEICL